MQTKVLRFGVHHWSAVPGGAVTGLPALLPANKGARVVVRCLRRCVIAITLQAKVRGFVCADRVAFPTLPVGIWGVTCQEAMGGRGLPNNVGQNGALWGIACCLWALAQERYSVEKERPIRNTGRLKS